MSPRSIPVALPRLLSLLPKDGVASRVYQSRWARKGLPVPSLASTDGTCYWEIKKVDLTFAEDPAKKPSAKAFGVFFWKGKRITPADQKYERIRKGVLKYGWESPSTPPLLVRPAPKAKEEEPEVTV